MIKARVSVTLKNGVLDPQGKAIEHALSALGRHHATFQNQSAFLQLTPNR